jgi:hypothetical protein
MDLLPFTAGHAGTVAGRPGSAAEVARWCGRAEFPPAGGGAGFVTVDAALAEEGNTAQPVAHVWLRHPETPA